MCILLLMAIDRFCNCVDTSHSKCLNTLLPMKGIFFCARIYAYLKDENHGGYDCAQKGKVSSAMSRFHSSERCRRVDWYVACILS